jgi:hypothetical protein
MDMIAWIAAALSAVALNLIASELFVWGPRISECLMRRAVRRLTPEIQERMKEEWAGHLQTIPPGLWRVVAAAGFYLAAHEINVVLRVRYGAEQEEAPGDDSLTMTLGRELTLEDLERLADSHTERPKCPDPWPSTCEGASDGQHEVGGALYPSARFGGARTFQGHCGICGKWVDTGEIFDC